MSDNGTEPLIQTSAESLHPGITEESNRVISVAIKTHIKKKEYARIILLPENKINELIRLLKLCSKK